MESIIQTQPKLNDDLNFPEEMIDTEAEEIKHKPKEKSYFRKFLDFFSDCCEDCDETSCDICFCCCRGPEGEECC